MFSFRGFEKVVAHVLAVCVHGYTMSGHLVVALASFKQGCCVLMALVSSKQVRCLLMVLVFV